MFAPKQNKDKGHHNINQKAKKKNRIQSVESEKESGKIDARKLSPYYFEAEKKYNALDIGMRSIGMDPEEVKNRKKYDANELNRRQFETRTKNSRPPSYSSWSKVKKPENPLDKPLKVKEIFKKVPLIGESKEELNDNVEPLFATENYKEKPVTTIDEDDFSSAQIKVDFVCNTVVPFGDEKRVAYFEFVKDTFGRQDDPGASFSEFAGSIKVPQLHHVNMSTQSYLAHLFGKEETKDKDLKLLEGYLLHRTKGDSLKVEDFSTVNNNLKKLWNLPTLMELEQNYENHEAAEKRRIEDYYLRKYPEGNEDVLPEVPMYEPELRDETDIHPFPYIDEDPTAPKKLSREDRISIVIKEAFAEPSSFDFGIYVYLKKALNHQLDKSLINRFANTLEPDMYLSYLESQEMLLLDSKLYQELKIARKVYQEYWKIVGEIFASSSDFDALKRDSWDYEKNLGGYSSDRNREMADYYMPLVSEIAFKSYAPYNELRQEYPQIEFGPAQFNLMWKIAGGFAYHYGSSIGYGVNSDPALFNAEPEFGGGIRLSDRNVADLLNTGIFSNPITLESMLDTDSEIMEGKDGTIPEFSLNEQIGSMVTQLETIRSTKRGIEYDLIGANPDKSNAIPFPAVLNPQDSRIPDQEPITLQLYFIKEGKNEWKLMDFSNPTARNYPTYSGEGDTDREAMLNAINNFATEAAYPEGDIVGTGLEKYFGEKKRVKAWSTGENWDINMSEDLGIISTITGVLGLVLLFTPLAPLGAGLLFVSGVTGAAAAGLRIKNRIEHETFTLDAQTMMDVIDIVSGTIVVGKIASSGMQIVNRASKGSKMAVLTHVIETGADTASVVIIGNEYLQRIEDVKNDETLSKEQRDTQIEALIYEAAGVGLLMLVGYAGPKIKRKFGKTRIKESLVQRIEEQSLFELKYTKSEIDLMVNEGIVLGLDDKVIEDFLYVGSRERKRIDSEDLIEFMNNWVEVERRGFPHGFKSKEEFNNFKKEANKLLQEAGINTYDVRVQGSALYKVTPDDTDIAVFLKDDDFDRIVSEIRAKYEVANKRAGKITKNSKNFEKDLNKGKVSSFHFANLPDGRTFDKAIFQEIGNVDISILKEGQKMDVDPYLKF